MIHDYELSCKAEYRVAEMSPNFTNISDTSQIMIEWYHRRFSEMGHFA